MRTLLISILQFGLFSTLGWSQTATQSCDTGLESHQQGIQKSCFGAFQYPSGVHCSNPDDVGIFGSVFSASTMDCHQWNLTGTYSTCESDRVNATAPCIMEFTAACDAAGGTTDITEQGQECQLDNPMGEPGGWQYWHGVARKHLTCRCPDGGTSTPPVTPVPTETPIPLETPLPF